MAISLPHKAGAVLVLGIGLALAGYAVREAQAYIASVEAANTTTIPVTQVLTFATDLKQGHLITKADLIARQFAVASVPPDAVPLDDVIGFYLERDVLAGDVARSPILSWEPIDKVPEPPVVLRVRRAGILELVTLP